MVYICGEYQDHSMGSWVLGKLDIQSRKMKVDLYVNAHKY